MRHLSLMSGLILTLGVGLGGATAGAQTSPATAPAAAPAVPLPIGLTATSTVTHLEDGLSGDLITTTIANAPIPDSPASRRINGGPESATGRATAPQPGVATTVRRTPKPYGPVLPPPTTPAVDPPH